MATEIRNHPLDRAVVCPALKVVPGALAVPGWVLTRSYGDCVTTSSNKMGSSSKPRLTQLAAAILTVVIGLGLAWLVLTGKPKPQPESPEAPLRPMVAVTAAEPSAQVLEVTTQGSVEPLRRINVVAQVAGKVASMAPAFEAGRFFKKGDVLLQLEQADYQFAIARARSSVAAAQQRLAEERGRNRQAKREWRDLGTNEANSLFLREPQMHAAEAALKAAEADLAAANLALERTTLRAPFDGRVETKRVDVGAYVAPGAVLGEIYATDLVQVRLPLNDRQLGGLGLSMHADAILAYPMTLTARFAGRDWQWPAMIRRLEAVVDRESRVVRAIAEVEQPFAEGTDGRPPLTPGMFVQGVIPGEAQPGVVMLPATALRADNSVLRVDGDDRLVRQQVQVLKRNNDRAWVRGLASGDRVVNEQSGVLVSGMLVTVADNFSGEQ